MRVTPRKLFTALFFAPGILISIIGLNHLVRAQNKIQPAIQNAEVKKRVSKSDATNSAATEISPAAVIAPFILQDTENDSPGTNNVTRIVTFSAEIGGTPPLFRQWKVNHGGGFVAIAGATNATFRIGNAQIADSGLYALFATNAAGVTHTTPAPLIVIEVED